MQAASAISNDLDESLVTDLASRATSPGVEFLSNDIYSRLRLVFDGVRKRQTLATRFVTLAAISGRALCRELFPVPWDGTCKCGLGLQHVDCNCGMLPIRTLVKDTDFFRICDPGRCELETAYISDIKIMLINSMAIDLKEGWGIVGVKWFDELSVLIPKYRLIRQHPVFVRASLECVEPQFVEARSVECLGVDYAISSAVIACYDHSTREAQAICKVWDGASPPPPSEMILSDFGPEVVSKHIFEMSVEALGHSDIQFFMYDGPPHGNEIARWIPREVRVLKKGDAGFVNKQVENPAISFFLDFSNGHLLRKHISIPGRFAGMFFLADEPAEDYPGVCSRYVRHGSYRFLHFVRRGFRDKLPKNIPRLLGNAMDKMFCELQRSKAYITYAELAASIKEDPASHYARATLGRGNDEWDLKFRRVALRGCSFVPLILKTPWPWDLQTQWTLELAGHRPLESGMSIESMTRVVPCGKAADPTDPFGWADAKDRRFFPSVKKKKRPTPQISRKGARKKIPPFPPEVMSPAPSGAGGSLYDACVLTSLAEVDS